MLQRLKKIFSKSSNSQAGHAAKAASIKGREAYNFAVGSGFIKGLKTLQKQTGGAFRIVKESIGEEDFTIELNMPSWKRSTYNPDRLEKLDTTLVVIRKRAGIFSDSYRLSTTTDVLWDESYYDFFCERDVNVYSLQPFDEKNSVEKTLRHLARRAQELGFFKHKPQDAPVKKQPGASNASPPAPHGFRL